MKLHRLLLTLSCSLLLGCISSGDDKKAESGDWKYMGPIMTFDSDEPAPDKEIGNKTVTPRFTVKNFPTGQRAIASGKIIHAAGKNYDLDGNVVDSAAWVYPGYRETLVGLKKQFNIPMDSSRVGSIIIDGSNISANIYSETDTVGKNWKTETNGIQGNLIYYNSERKSFVLLYVGKEDASTMIYVNRVEISALDGKILLTESKVLFRGGVGPAAGGGKKGISFATGKPILSGKHIYIFGTYHYAACCFSLPGSHDGDVFSKEQISFGFIKLKEDDLSLVWEKQYRLDHLPTDPAPNAQEKNELANIAVDKSGNIYGIAKSEGGLPEGVRGTFTVFKLNSSGEKAWTRRFLSEKGNQGSDPMVDDIWVAPDDKVYFSYSLYFANRSPWFSHISSEGKIVWATNNGGGGTWAEPGFTGSGQWVIFEHKGLDLNVSTLD